MKRPPPYLTEQNLGEIFRTLVSGLKFEHNKTVPGSGIKTRPDYRFDEIGLIVEFDGNHHYQDANVIFRDGEKDKAYTDMGYRVERIPYFIQMTSELLYRLFGQKIPYAQSYPHGFIDGDAVLPANFCELGIKQFIRDLNKFGCYKNDIIASLRQKIAEKEEINLVLPPTLHYLIK